MCAPTVAALRSFVLAPSSFDPTITALHWPNQPQTPILFVRTSKATSPHLALLTVTHVPNNSIGTATFTGKSTAEISLRGHGIQAKVNPLSGNCKVEAGQLGSFKLNLDPRMGSEALDMVDAGGVRLARIDRGGKGTKKLDLFVQLDGIMFEMVVLIALATWTMHKEMDKVVLKGLTKALFSF